MMNNNELLIKKPNQLNPNNIIKKPDKTQSDNNLKMEPYHPFQMRTRNLDRFKNDPPPYRLNQHKKVISRAKIGCLTSTSRSLDLLRSCLQDSFDQEINQILQRYLNQYFNPAINNIRLNNGENSVSDYHIQNVFRQFLEEAKKMYLNPDSAKISTPTATINSIGFTNDRKKLNSKNRRDSENNFNVVNSRKQKFNKLRLPSCSEMEKKKIKQIESREIRKAMLNKRKLSNNQCARGRPLNSKSKSVQLGEDNLNKDRITSETEFVLGSKANRALGFESARGRLYTKHTDLFKYNGDSADKQYLHEKGLFPISGARAFLIIKEDIEKILKSEEYKDAPGLKETGFVLPDFILTKIKNQMEKQKIEREKLIQSTDDDHNPNELE